MIILFLKTIIIGFISGFILGFGSKKISKLLIVIIAIIFIGLEFLVYNGNLDLNFGEVGSAAVNFLKENNWIITGVKQIFFANVALAVSILIGFLFGFKKG